MQLDIAEFHTSITKEILDNAILFVQQYIDILEKDLRIKKNIVGNPYYTMITSLVRKKYRKLLRRHHG